MQISLNLTYKQVSCLPKSYDSVINNSSGDSQGKSMTPKCLFLTLLMFEPYHEENWTFHYKKVAVVLETAAMVNFEDQIYQDIFVKLIQENYSNLDIIHTQCSNSYESVVGSETSRFGCSGDCWAKFTASMHLFTDIGRIYTSSDRRHRWRFLCCCIHKSSSRYVLN